MTQAICRDLDRLVPCFRARVDVLLERLEARGFSVQVWETYRSPARVRMLAAKGTGSARSVHPYGVAVDIVENDKTPWTLAKPGLWEAISEEAAKLGLHRVHRRMPNGKRVLDGPHVQALAPKYDLKVAKVPEFERDAWVRERMLPPKPPDVIRPA